jgi:hypothetical protein
MTTTETTTSGAANTAPGSARTGRSWKVPAMLGFAAAWLLAFAGRLADAPPIVGWVVIGLAVAALVAVRAVAARRRGAK